MAGRLGQSVGCATACRERRCAAGGTRSRAASSSSAVDDASGSGAGDGVSYGADAGTGGTVRIGQTSRQLFWADPARTIQRGETAAGKDQQTGQFVAALFAGGG